MIPVLVDGVKKYLLTEEEVDAKISASSGGSSSEIDPQSLNLGTPWKPCSYAIIATNENDLPTPSKKFEYMIAIVINNGVLKFGICTNVVGNEYEWDMNYVSTNI